MSGGDEEVFDYESVYEEAPKLGAPVDPPDEPQTLYGTVVALRDDKRRPIVPAWVRNAEQRIQFLRWAVRWLAYWAGYHLFWSPKYMARVAWRAPIGAGRLAWKGGKWAVHGENIERRQTARRRDDNEEYLKVVAKNDVERHMLVALAVLFALALAVALVASLAPWYVKWPLAVAAVLALAKVGSPIGKPITDRVSTTDRPRKLTAPMTRKALVATGKVKDPASVSFPIDIGRDGPGQRAIVDLPDGVIATDVIDERDRLAGGFRLPKVQVWPATIPGEHPGRLEIWVADKPLSAITMPTFPLLKAGMVDYFRPVPVGYDPRLRPQLWAFDQKNTMLAGIPGSGKSLDVRVLMLAAVLDPLVIPAAFELKGTGDYRCIKAMCPEGFYGSGADQATKQAMFDFLEWLEDECDRRGPLVEKYAAAGLNDTNNVNRAMAEKDPRLRMIVAALDELQELFTDPELGKQAKKTAISVVKRGRALGIHLILATQRIDKESVPRGLSSNVALRACGAVTAYTECDMVLGTGAYSRGARPTEFETATNDDPKDSGWVWRVGLGPMAPMRFYYVSNRQAEQIAARAIKMREAMNPVDMPVVKVQVFNLLEDVRRVWPRGEQAVWSELIVPMLQELRPDIYEDLTVEIFGARMAASGVPTAKIGRRIEGRPTTRAGVHLHDLDQGIKARKEITSD